MGNQQSNSKDKESQLWSHWSPTKKEQLKSQFETLKYGNKAELPDYFSRDLYSCIATKLQSQDISHYLEIANGTLKSKDTSIIFSIFQYAVEKDQISLEAFVSCVINSAIPIWFESGSSYQWCYKNENSNLLVKYILNHAQNNERQKNDTMAWLYDDDKGKDNKPEQQTNSNSWETKATESPSKISLTEFTHWIDNTPAFISLFQLVMEYILLGQPTGKVENLHKRRIDHLSSPKVQQHNDKELKRLFGKNKFSSLINSFDYFLLTQYLPLDALSWSDYEKDRRKFTQDDLQHELIFSSRRDGNSWQVFANKMISKGATLVIIKTKDGSTFGGYADDAWEYAKTDWYGNSRNFLFKLSGEYGAWRGANSNNHYQYLCWGKKSLPNGFGMGGQFDYAGLWIDSDFIHGHSRAGPLNTTYSSPRLSESDTFIIDEVEGM